ncbi:MAG: T9SS type A sorting domain-containing protein [Candidatus Fermentibacteraceae bacterium]|nr:T9SS type A sorting domain-containing protein [Candidatus Fermentibacteraceae bacterium]
MIFLMILALCSGLHPLLQEQALRRPLPVWTVVETDHPDDPVDILHYDLAIEVFRDVQEIYGITGILMTSAGGAVSDIRLDLRQLTVDSVWDAGGNLSYYQQQDSLFITLSSPLTPADTTEVFVAYGGTPYHESWGGFWFHPYITYQIGVGIYTPGQCMGKCMFPCWDFQNDKASYDFHITCPDTLYAVANGDSAGVEYAGGKATFHWTFDQPLPTYLVTMAVGEYAVLHDSTDSRIYYYVYEWEIDDALGSFVNVDLMLANLESLFGAYPWDCKFSLVETPNGDMEHTSAIAHWATAVNGTTYWEWLIAHEMTHHWWGCCVSHEDWQSIWLKEAFATYGEALWAETFGEYEYTEYMVQSIMIPYLNSGELFPIAYPTTPSQIFGYTTYEKAASVLHMLRYVLGDDDFFDSMNWLFQQHMYGLVTNEDFHDAVEYVTGEDIDWFMDTWIYDWGYPVYDITGSWTEILDAWELTLTVDQTQTTGPFFEMPLEFLVQGVSQDTLVTMWNEISGQQEIYQISFEPVEVIFDPYSHILCGNVLTGIEETPLPPDGLGTVHMGPNPCAGSTSLIWDGADSMELRVTVYDMTGRVCMVERMMPGERTLDVSVLPPAMYLLDVRGEGVLRQSVRLVVLDQ